jgi:hypothetical protein
MIFEKRVLLSSKERFSLDSNCLIKFVISLNGL